MKHLKKLISLTIATLLAFTCYVGYQEVSADVTADGHFDVTNTTEGASSTDGWLYDSGVITISQTGDYTISKACSCSEDTVHSSYSIVIGANITVNLTIEDVMIENTSGAAMNIDGTSTVTLILVGDNSFTSATNYAGIQFNNAGTLNGSLTITSDNEDNTLTAEGGSYGAGIGGGVYASASNITISGGTVIANGGSYGAGIGGGEYASASNINITGGTITAKGGYGSAGIGGGYEGSGSNITISGGTVTASSGSYSAGIGGGCYGSASNITISGGTVTATGGYRAAGIGGGYGDSGSNITISGGSVKATGTNNSDISVTPQNEDDEYVYLATIADVENVQSVTVDGKDFNISSNHPDDNTLYLYLTDGEHEIEIIAGNKIYEAVWNDDSQSYELQYVKDVETSTEGTTGSSSSGTIIVDTSTR